METHSRQQRPRRRSREWDRRGDIVICDGYEIRGIRGEEVWVRCSGGRWKTYRWQIMKEVMRKTMRGLPLWPWCKIPWLLYDFLSDVRVLSFIPSWFINTAFQLCRKCSKITSRFPHEPESISCEAIDSGTFCLSWIWMLYCSGCQPARSSVYSRRRSAPHRSQDGLSRPGRRQRSQTWGVITHTHTHSLVLHNLLHSVSWNQTDGFSRGGGREGTLEGGNLLGS